MIKDEKAALRAQLRAAIASLPEGYIASSDAGIMENVLALAEFSAAGRMFAYFSVGRECATAGIIAAAVAAGKAVALPKTQGAGRMYFAAHTGALGAGRYGIPEPPAEAEALLPGRGDALIVPALCCDEAGYRLGQGGGYYDRLLAGCRAVSICLCRERLLRKKIPREWNDLAVDIVVTEERALRIK